MPNRDAKHEDSATITIVDCNNFWSPSGGGVRRYHLEKIAGYRNRRDFLLVFVMHDAATWTERVSDSVVIEHIAVKKIDPRLDYRFLWSCRPLTAIFRKYRPDIVEIGSPYIMPALVARALKMAGCLAARRIGFWHADFPSAYIERWAMKIHPLLAKMAVSFAWRFARRTFNSMDGVFCSSRRVMARMEKNGIGNVVYLPLGVDADLFHPGRRSDDFRAVILGPAAKDGRIIFFPHRFSAEKGLPVLLAAYERIFAAVADPPALVFAGKGPDLPLIEAAVVRYPGRVHFLGFIESAVEMAMLHSSADLGLALSKWETFGLSMLESMAAGLPQIGANSGAAAEHIDHSGGGLAIDTEDDGALAEAILRLLHATDLPEYRNRARRYAEQFTWDNCFARQRELYREYTNCRF